MCTTTCSAGGATAHLILDQVLELRSVTLCQCPRGGDVIATPKSTEEFRCPDLLSSEIRARIAGAEDLYDGPSR